MELDLAPGIYNLSQTVINPTPDRRQRYDWRKRERFDQGELFTVKKRTYDCNHKVAEVYLTGIPYTHQTVSCNSDKELYGAIAPYLVRQQERTLQEVYAANGVDGSVYERKFIIDQLLKMGKVTLDDINAAIKKELEE